MTASEDPKRQLLRHTLATLAYRGGKAIRDAPPKFADFRVGERSRTPVAILAHVGDLLDWALSIARGAQAWHDSAPSPWKRESTRFFEGLERLDQYLASDAPLHAPGGEALPGRDRRRAHARRPDRDASAPGRFPR